MFAYRLEHEVRVPQDHRVVEAQNRIARLGQPGVTVRIRFLAQTMDTPVSLDDQQAKSAT